MTAPLVAQAKLASTAKPAGVRHPQDPMPSMPLSGPKDDWLDLGGLRPAFSEWRVG